MFDQNCVDMPSKHHRGMPDMIPKAYHMCNRYAIDVPQTCPRYATNIP